MSESRRIDDSEAISRILEVFDENESFLIFNHIGPDGDAVGSQIALGKALQEKGKRVFMYAADEVFDEYRFLPGVDDISTEFPSAEDFDIAVMLDCANPGRTGMDVDLEAFKGVVNIDHHVSNTLFGTVNWVGADRSSAGELVYELLKAMGSTVDEAVATCLYTAMLTDTGGFRHSNTGEKTLRYASELVGRGARPDFIARKVNASYPEGRFKLLGKSLETLRRIEEGRVAYMWVYSQFYDETGTTVVDADEFVEYPRSIEGVEIAVLFKETEANGSARVNFRSNSPERDVNKVAAAFGGGGHSEASACNIEGTREEIERRVIGEVRRALGAVSA